VKCVRCWVEMRAVPGVRMVETTGGKLKAKLWCCPKCGLLQSFLAEADTETLRTLNGVTREVRV